MLYLEDYLELIEHLPQELRDRLTLIRENDLKVNNTCSQIYSQVEQLFANAKDSNPEQRQCDYEKILKEYERTLGYADQKVQLSDQTHEIMSKLIERLDGELEKFKLELEADHAGITEELERRSLEQEASDSRLEESIRNHLKGPTSQNKHTLGFKDRRRSEHKQHHRHHPYYYDNNHHQDNGYHFKAKLSQQQHPYQVANNSPGVHTNNKQMPQPLFDNSQGIARFFDRINPHGHRQNHSNASSPLPYGPANQSAPTSISDGYMMNGAGGGHYGSNITSFGNNPGFKYIKNKNSTSNQQHSALSAALSSATLPTNQSSLSNSNLMDSLAIQNNKISTNTGGKGIRDLNDHTSPLVRRDPLAAAASQAIAATQQLHQGRRTSSLKASFAALTGAGGLAPESINCKESRNALAPMAPDQQAFNFNDHYYGKLKSNGSSSPLYVSVTKSGRSSKRPKHHTNHLYPDESPPSISSDNSVFENSESMSSADFIDASNTFGSASPSSYNFHNSSRAFSEQSDAGNGTFYHQPDQTKYCICQQISYGEMVACDNEDCEIEWFHYGCVGISNPPKGKWFCPDCKKKMSLNKQHHDSGAQQTQTHKKRGRKEILGN